MISVPLQRSAPPRLIWQGVLATGLRVSGWVLVNAMVALGVLNLATLVIGGFSIEGAMHHVANLAPRYLAASAERQHQFDLILLWTVSLAFCGTGFFRRHSLIQALLKESADD